MFSRCVLFNLSQTSRFFIESVYSIYALNWAFLPFAAFHGVFTGTVLFNFLNQQILSVIFMNMLYTLFNQLFKTREVVCTAKAILFLHFPILLLFFFLKLLSTATNRRCHAYGSVIFAFIFITFLWIIFYSTGISSPLKQLLTISVNFFHGC